MTIVNGGTSFFDWNKDMKRIGGQTLARVSEESSKAKRPNVEYLEQLAQRLAAKLEEPREDLPAVRCVSQTTLYSLFQEARGELKRDGLACSIKQEQVLAFLLHMSVLRPIPVRGEGKPVRGVAYFAVGFEPAFRQDVDPKELLQAAFPDGVICYFTALGFHRLTTQVPSHHHIARIREDREVDGSGPSRGRQRKNATYSGMGRFLFRYGSDSYYWTTRSPRLLRAFKTWRLNPKLSVRVVTREQALIDALHKPIRCGGPAVVREAWEEAVESEEWDPGKLAEILAGSEDGKLARRAGYLLAELGVATEGTLYDVVRQACDEVDRSDLRAAPSLFPDYTCPIYDEKWHLMLPSW